MWLCIYTHLLFIRCKWVQSRSILLDDMRDLHLCAFLMTPQMRNRSRCALPIGKLVSGDFAAQLIYTMNTRLSAEQKRIGNAGKRGSRGGVQLVCNERRGRGIYPGIDRRKSKGIRISASPACIYCCVDKLRPFLSISQFNSKKSLHLKKLFITSLLVKIKVWRIVEKWRTFVKENLIAACKNLAFVTFLYIIFSNFDALVFTYRVYL